MLKRKLNSRLGLGSAAASSRINHFYNDFCKGVSGVPLKAAAVQPL